MTRERTGTFESLWTSGVLGWPRQDYVQTSPGVVDDGPTRSSPRMAPVSPRGSVRSREPRCPLALGDCQDRSSGEHRLCCQFGATVPQLYQQPAHGAAALPTALRGPSISRLPGSIASLRRPCRAR